MLTSFSFRLTGVKLRSSTDMADTGAISDIVYKNKDSHTPWVSNMRVEAPTTKEATGILYTISKNDPIGTRTTAMLTLYIYTAPAIKSVKEIYCV